MRRLKAPVLGIGNLVRTEIERTLQLHQPRTFIGTAPGFAARGPHAETAGWTYPVQQLAGSGGQCWRVGSRPFFHLQLFSRLQGDVDVLANTGAWRHGQPLADISRLADLERVAASCQALTPGCRTGCLAVHREAGLGR